VGQVTPWGEKKTPKNYQKPIFKYLLIKRLKKFFWDVKIARSQFILAECPSSSIIILKFNSSL
jgi:hypothetical protein